MLTCGWTCSGGSTSCVFRQSTEEWGKSPARCIGTCLPAGEPISIFIAIDFTLFPACRYDTHPREVLNLRCRCIAGASMSSSFSSRGARDKLKTRLEQIQALITRVARSKRSVIRDVQSTARNFNDKKNTGNRKIICTEIYINQKWGPRILEFIFFRTILNYRQNPVFNCGSFQVRLEKRGRDELRAWFENSRVLDPAGHNYGKDGCCVIALISRVALDRALFLPSANSRLQPAETTRSVGIRDVTPYVPSLGIVEERGGKGYGGREVSASANTWMHTGERRMR